MATTSDDDGDRKMDGSRAHNYISPPKTTWH